MAPGRDSKGGGLGAFDSLTGRLYHNRTMSRNLDELQSALGYRFENVNLLRRALRHASAAQGTPSNERLEFLGDAVVGLIVAAHLFRDMPDAPEGQMTVIKSVAVSRKSLAQVGYKLGLHEQLVTDNGLQHQAFPSSLAANAYEAVVGSIFLDGGLEPARRFVLDTLSERIKQARESRSAAGWKSILQECVQARGQPPPLYEIVNTEGPDHDRKFQAVVIIAGQTCGSGWGSAKKDAEQTAARAALEEHFPDWRD
ncbi:MAG: ribonuclease III [Planctomycetes bacterium]|nr:ribonuclease III [Planctomycetota bacterium]